MVHNSVTQLRCEDCGRFIAYDDAWIAEGSYFDSVLCERCAVNRGADVIGDGASWFTKA